MESKKKKKKKKKNECYYFILILYNKQFVQILFLVKLITNLKL